jgi:hypothetical protein
MIGLLNGTNTATPGNWGTIYWNTGVKKFYNVHLANRPLPTKYKIGRITGIPAGTGNATVSVYLNGTLDYTKTYVEKYVLGLVAATNVLDSVINIDETPNLYVGPSQAAIVRVTRATTVTTNGLISVISEAP